MKKILIVFLSLILVFAGVWITKSKTPAARPDPYPNGITEEQAWWLVRPDTSNVASEWRLDPEIPQNYLPVPGEDELYMIVDDSGYIVKYRHREKQGDGSWMWTDVNPDIPDDYEAVEGLENIYRVTKEDGKVVYVKYIRNEDDTFAFVPCNENGEIIDEDPVGAEIPENYEHLAGNVYAVKDDNGVVIEYKERTVDDDGNYEWEVVFKPTQEEIDQTNNPTLPSPTLPDVNIDVPSGTGNNGGNMTGSDIGEVVVNTDPEPETEYIADGSYKETESYTTTETLNGWIITYQTTIERTYDANGNLVSTKKDGPYEVSRTASNSGGSTADPSQVASTLSGELARVSVGVSFNDSLAEQILAKMNAERAAAGKAQLSMSGSDAYTLARTRAAAMAAYDYSDYNSPLYGTLETMCNTYGISSISPSENTWRTTTDKTADAINARFMSIDASASSMLSGEYSSVGIAVAEKNGYYYICEVFIN